MTATMAIFFGSLLICGAVAAEGGLLHENLGPAGGKVHDVSNENTHNVSTENMPLDGFAIVAHRSTPQTNMNLEMVNSTSNFSQAGCAVYLGDGCYRGNDCFQCSNGCPMAPGTGCACPPQCRFMGMEPPGCSSAGDGCHKGSDCFHCPNFCEMALGDGCTCPNQCQVGAQPAGCTRGGDGCYYGSGCYYCPNGCKMELGAGCSCPSQCQRIEDASCVQEENGCYEGTQCYHCTNGCEMPLGAGCSCATKCQKSAPASVAQGLLAENLRTIQV